MICRSFAAFFNVHRLRDWKWSGCFRKPQLLNLAVTKDKHVKKNHSLRPFDGFAINDHHLSRQLGSGETIWVSRYIRKVVGPPNIKEAIDFCFRVANMRNTLLYIEKLVYSRANDVGDTSNEMSKFDGTQKSNKWCLDWNDNGTFRIYSSIMTYGTKLRGDIFLWWNSFWNICQNISRDTFMSFLIFFTIIHIFQSCLYGWDQMKSSSFYRFFFWICELKVRKYLLIE